MNDDPAVTAIKIFGERNTATNALRKLIAGIPGASPLPSTASEIDEDAYRRIRQECWDEVETREARIDGIFAQAGERSAWKHCATKFVHAAPFESCLVLFTVRHPASWLVGLFGNPYHALAPIPHTLPAFINFDWETVGRERLRGETFKPLQLYDAKLRSYLEFSTRLERAGIAYRFIRFEDIVLQQEQVFRSVAEHIGRPDVAFTPVDDSTKTPGRKLADYQDYYGRERWRERIEGLESQVDELIDWELTAFLGYKPLSAGS